MGTFYNRSKTASADTPFQIDDGNTYLSSFNIQCTTNDLYYGDKNNQQGIIRVGAVVWFDKPVKVSDLWFKNYTAGNNCVVTIDGTLVNED